MGAGTRAALLAGTLPVVALGIETSRLAAAHADAALGGGAPWESAVQVGAAAAAIAAGMVLVLNRRVNACGALLALTGPAILLAQVPVPDASSALLFTAALAGGSLAPGAGRLSGTDLPGRAAAPLRLGPRRAQPGHRRGHPRLAAGRRVRPAGDRVLQLPGQPRRRSAADPALCAGSREPWGLILAIALGGWPGRAARAGDGCGRPASSAW